MKRFFCLAIASLCVLGSVTGCESFGLGKKRDVDPRFEPKAPVEGAKGLVDSARPSGAWSSEAGSIEKSLNNRSADPNW